ncbi:MAG: OmpA family protein [Spirosomataceae bacterium]
MNSKTPWWIALVLWMGGSTYWHVCKVKQLCYDAGTPATEVKADTIAAVTPPALDSSAVQPDTTAPPPTTEEKLAQAEKYESVFKPITVYFNTGKTDYIRTGENKKFVDEAKSYLAEHKDKKLLLAGHADNVGPDDLNLRLSQKRADAVKAQLTKAGIPSEQIVVEAKGETMPKASNDTPDGRKANRRVELVVQ